MNRLFFLTLFLTGILFKLYSQDTAIVTGKIINPKEKKVSFEEYNEFLDEEVKVKLNNDGTFYYKLELDSSKIKKLIFDHGNESTIMYVSPNDSIHLTLNTDFFDESLVYSGVGSNKNNLYKEMFLKFYDTDSKTYKNPVVHSMKTDSFLLYRKKIRDDELSFIDKFNEKNPIKAEYLNLFKSNVELDYYIDICSFATGLPDSVFLKMVSDSLNLFKAELENFDSSNVSSIYIQRVPSYIRYKTKDYLLNNPKCDTLPYFIHEIYVAKKELSQKQLDYYLTYLMNDMLYSRVRYLTYKEIIDVLVQKIKDPYYKYIVHTKISKYNRNYKTKLPKGVKLHNISNNFDDIIKKYRGKVIYVDFWASWCGPCVNEMKYYPELRSKLDLNNIVFVYVSSDINEKAYKYAIKRFNIIGEHYRLTKEERNRNHKKYNYYSIPTHMIFDKNGNLVTNKAPKPSDEKLVEMLQKLSKQQ